MAVRGPSYPKRPTDTPTAGRCRRDAVVKGPKPVLDVIVTGKSLWRHRPTSQRSSSRIGIVDRAIREHQSQDWRGLSSRSTAPRRTSLAKGLREPDRSDPSAIYMVRHRVLLKWRTHRG